MRNVIVHEEFGDDLTWIRNQRTEDGARDGIMLQPQDIGDNALYKHLLPGGAREDQ